MKKVGFTLIIFFSFFLFSACTYAQLGTFYDGRNKDFDYYMYFNEDEYEIKVGESVNIFSFLSKSSSYEVDDIEISSKDESLVNVKGYFVKGVDCGSTQLIVCVPNKNFETSVNIKVIENDSSENQNNDGDIIGEGENNESEENLYTYNLEVLDYQNENDYKTYKFTIKKDGVNFSNFYVNRSENEDEFNFIKNFNVLFAQAKSNISSFSIKIYADSECSQQILLIEYPF